jgi:archaeosine-15-forming tRNA-guanine transglycosylase
VCVCTDYNSSTNVVTETQRVYCAVRAKSVYVVMAVNCAVPVHRPLPAPVSGVFSVVVQSLSYIHKTGVQ